VLANRGSPGARVAAFGAGSCPLSSRLVVIIKGKNNPRRGCDTVVAFWRPGSRPWFPYGLAVVNASEYARRTDLSRWWLVSSARNPMVTYGPAGVKVPNPIIDTTGSSGAGGLYACYTSQ